MQSLSLLAFNIMQPPRFLFVCLFISLCYSFNCPRFLPITLPLVPPSSTLSWPSNTPPRPPPPTPQPKRKKKSSLNGCVIILASSTHLPRTCWSAQCKHSCYELDYLWFRFLLFYFYILFCLATIWQKNAQLKSSTLRSGSGFGSWS